jgi:hypothetical protein
MGVAISVVASAAMFLPLPAGATQDRDRASFAEQSRVATDFASDGDGYRSAWIIHGNEDYRGDHYAGEQSHSGGRDFHGDEWAGNNNYADTFARYGERHHSHDGGGWAEHGGEYDGHHDCDGGCVGTAAVPEPKSVALTLAGLLGLLLLVKRQRRAGFAFFGRR